jgi:3'-5' exoribonuclease
MERLWVKDVQVGDRASGTFLVVRKQQGMGRNEKPYLRLTLQDKTGQLDARVWDRAEEFAPLFEIGDRVQVDGQVGSFQGRPQLTIEQLEKSQAEHDPADFEWEAPAKEPQAEAAPARGGGDAQVAQLRHELSRVEDPHVRALLLSFIDDPEIASRLARAPAAKEIHHAYAGGLAEHILSCVRLAQRLADHYPMADRDLLVAGAFLHDLGKVQELSWEKGGTTYTDEGRLVGHLVMTAQWIAERAKVITGFPKDLEIHLTHIVLAHHGRLEYGSPKIPHTLEAFLVHALDEIDSRVNQMLGQMAQSPGAKWAEPKKHWERLLWKAPAPTEGGKERGEPWRQTRRRRKRKGAAEGPRAQEATTAPQGERQRRDPTQRREAPAEAGGQQERQRREPGPGRQPRQQPAGPRQQPPKREEEKLTFKPFFQLPGQEAEGPAEAQAPEPTPEPTETQAVETQVQEPTPQPVEAQPEPQAQEPTPQQAEVQPAEAQPEALVQEPTPQPGEPAPEAPSGDEPEQAS